MKKGNLISDFFPKRPKFSNNDIQDSPNSTVQQISVVEIQETSSNNDLIGQRNNIVSLHTNDIASLLLKQESLTDEDRFRLLKGNFAPEDSFKFPLNTFGMKKRSFKRTWLDQYTWLVYSESLDKCFCRFCIAFQKCGDGPGLPQFSCLITDGLSNWKNAQERLKAHQKADYHIGAALFAANFVSNLASCSSIACSINQQRKEEIARNKAIFRSIIETLILCGRQSIALRGTNESGRITEEDQESNDGNFRALLRFRMNCGDEILKQHFKFAKANALYTSPFIQNQLIELCGENILSQIVTKVKHATFFAILVDETIDVSTTEQLSISLRYVDAETNEISEDFVGFTEVSSLSGEALTNAILNQLNKLDLNVKNLRGQSYDGAANMSGKLKGVQSRIKELYPKALYTYCANHKLNLVISDSCTIPEIRNCIGNVKEVQTFFSRSLKRSEILKKCIIDGNDEDLKKRRLVNLCETRWVERHESLINFYQLFVYVVSALEVIENTAEDSLSKSKSHNLLASILNPGFIVALRCSELILSTTVALSRALQNLELDLHNCYEMVTYQLAVLGSIKENCIK